MVSILMMIPKFPSANLFLNNAIVFSADDVRVVKDEEDLIKDGDPIKDDSGACTLLRRFSELVRMVVRIDVVRLDLVIELVEGFGEDNVTLLR
jgi:hypothetical protein